MANRAFLVGINQYSRQVQNLRGCVNDMESLARLLVTKYEFDEQYILDHRLLDQAATGAAIKAGLQHLLQGSQAGDVLVFAFSGHGSQIATTNDQNEIDGKDEYIVPYEMTREALISDDDIDEIVRPYIPREDVNFTAIYDCCHSGTMFRELAFDEESSDWRVDVVNRFLDYDELLRTWELTREGVLRKEVKVGDYNILSACADEETAADLRDAGGLGAPRGAFSFVLHRLLTDDPHVRFEVLEAPLLEGIQQLTKHIQTPQYYGPHPESPLFSTP